MKRNTTRAHCVARFPRIAFSHMYRHINQGDVTRKEDEEEVERSKTTKEAHLRAPEKRNFLSCVHFEIEQISHKLFVEVI